MKIAKSICAKLIPFDSEKIYVENDEIIYEFEDCVENSFFYN